MRNDTSGVKDLALDLLLLLLVSGTKSWLPFFGHFSHWEHSILSLLEDLGSLSLHRFSVSSPEAFFMDYASDRTCHVLSAVKRCLNIRKHNDDS